MALVEAAAGLCDLIWMIDGSLPEMQEMTELLRRFGPVVDRSGASAEELLAAVAAHRPDGLTSYLDAGMAAYASLAATLGLPFHSPDTAGALTDKARQRQLLAAAGLASPRCRVVPPGSGTDVLARVAPDQQWPAILKPRSAQGSRYTFKADDARHAAGLLDALGSGRPEMVLEDFLADGPGPIDSPYANYVSVESLAADGVLSNLALTGRFPLAENFRETGFFIPALLDPSDQEQALALAGAAIEALGVRTGCLHTEIKFTPQGPVVIEVNGRVGGGVPEMLQRSCGLPLLELTLRLAMGEAVVVDGPVPSERIGYRLFLQPPSMSATIGAIDGIDAISDHPQVDTVSVHQGPGAALDWRDGSRNHILAVVGSVSSHEELRAVERLLHQEVTVTYSEVWT